MNVSAIRFTGLASGIDTASIIENLMKLERRPIQRLNAERDAIGIRQAALNEIGGLLTGVRNAARDLSSPTALLSAGARSTNATVAEAHATSGAAHGSYNISVPALARTHTAASDIGATLTAGTHLDITAGGITHSVQVQEGDTLMSFAARINATEGAGATASVIDGRLMLSARTSGQEATFTLGGDAAPGLNMTTTQTGQDATVHINGLTVTRPTNTITDAIDGVSLTLTAQGQTTVDVGLDTDAATAEARGFVDAYNNLMRNLRAVSAYDPASGTAGTLQGDQTINQIAGQLRTVAGSAVSGADGAHTTLASIGITSGRDGLLRLDEDAFAAALNQNPDGVRAVFGRDDGIAGVGAGDGIARRLGAIADDLATNSIGARNANYASTLGRIDKKIADMEQFMSLREQTLRGQWQAMERAVSQINGQGAFLGAYFNTFA